MQVLNNNILCPHCHSANQEPFLFCVKCGYPLADVTERSRDSVETPLDINAPSAIYKVCSHCLTANSKESNYCSQCGFLLPKEIIVQVKPLEAVAGFWIRSAAYLIDIFAIYLIWLAIVMIFMDKTITQVAEVITSMANGQPADTTAYLVLFAVEIIYFTFTTGTWGRTIGKALLGLKVLRNDGSRVSYLRSFARTMVGYFSFGVGYILIALTPYKRGLHDLLCGTKVLKLK